MNADVRGTGDRVSRILRVGLKLVAVLESRPPITMPLLAELAKTLQRVDVG